MEDQSPYQAEAASPFSALSGFEIEREMLRRLSACEDVSAFRDAIGLILEGLGFDAFAFSLISSKSRAVKLAAHNLPDDLVRMYEEEQYHRWDTVPDYVFHNHSPVFYSDLMAGLYTLPFNTEAREKNREISALYRNYGYDDFHITPLHRRERVSYLMVACRESMGVDGSMAPALPGRVQPVLVPASGGLYVLPVRVNGAKGEVDFLIDTGASHIMLRREDAKSIGLDVDSLTYNRSYETANGGIRAASVRLDSLTVGPIRLSNIPAAVNKSDMAHSVLGQTFLKRLASVEIANGHMILRP